MAVTYLRGVQKGRLSASIAPIAQSRTYPNRVAGTSPPPLYASGAQLPVAGMDHIDSCAYLLCIYSKEYGAVKWSTDPSWTVDTYLRNLLPEHIRKIRNTMKRAAVMCL
jgi:hypothetical protein